LKTTPRCLKCEINGAFEQIKLSTDDEKLRFKALQLILSYLSDSHIRFIPPAEMGTRCNRIIREVTSTSDPYIEIKEKMNEVARELKPIAKEYIEKGKESEDRLRRALKVATIGNSFDFSVSEHDVAPSTTREKFKQDLTGSIYLDDRDLIVSRIISSNKILYILDNAGEVILDRLLMEKIQELEIELYIAARSEPAQDDVTIKMGKELNLHNYGNLISTGQSVGINLEEAPEEFKERLEEVGIVISKGQGNFETLSEYEEYYKRKIAYLLMAKCKPVSDNLKVPRGSKIISLSEK